MDIAVSALLKLLVLLQIKHLLADFFLQTGFMLSGNWRYLHAGRAAHCAVHAAGTVLVLLLMRTSPALLLAMVAAEFVVHFHIDWLKARHGRATGYDTSDRRYWQAFGTDQLAHQLTYLGMGWWWIAAQAA
jgi:hypothetical protein